MFDENGKNLLLTRKFTIQAVPPGVFVESSMQNDRRRVRNLVNGNSFSNSYEDIFLTLFASELLPVKGHTQVLIGVEL